MHRLRMGSLSLGPLKITGLRSTHNKYSYNDVAFQVRVGRNRHGAQRFITLNIGSQF